MKRVGISLAAVSTLVLLALLVLPSFVDWTSYRDSFSERISLATGRSVVIEGDVSFTMLPRPAVRVEKVRVGSIPGATRDDFLQAETVDVNLALGPLFTGQLKFVSISVINPVVFAEVLGDGSETWRLPGPAAEESSAETSSSEAAPNLAVDQMSIVDGVVEYRDARSGASYDVTGINADLVAESLTGPFQLAGQAELNDMPWLYEISIGQLREQRPTSLNVQINGPDNSLEGKFLGRFNDADEGLSGSGRLTLSSPEGATALAKLGLLDSRSASSEVLRKPFVMTVELDAEPSSVTAKEIEIDVGGLKAGGTGGVSFKATPQFDLVLRAPRINLAAVIGTQSMPSDEGGDSAQVDRAAKQTSELDQPVAGNFSLPKDVIGNIDLRVDLVEWRGQLMRNGVFAASIAESEITVAELGVELPGNSALGVTGFVREDDGQPRFDLRGDMSSRNLRGLLAWVDVQLDDTLVPPSRLNALVVSSRVTGTPDQIDLKDLTVQLDSTALAGSASYKPGSLGRIDVDLAVSRLDLDSYLPALQKSFSNAPGDSVLGDSPQVRGDGQDRTSSQRMLPATELQVSVSVESLTAAGQVFQGVRVDAALEDGVVRVNEASVTDIAGARILMYGEVTEPLADIQFTDVTVEVASDDLSRTARTLALDFPVLPIMSDPAAFRSSLTGTPDAISFKTDGTLGALVVAVTGQLTSLSGNPVFDIKPVIQHPNYSTMLEGFGMRLAESDRPLGAVTIAGSVNSQAPDVYVSEFTFSADENVFSAAIQTSLQEAQVSVSGDIEIIRAEFDRLIPPDPTEVLTRQSRSRSSSGSGAVSGRWSAEPIDLGLLANINADLNISAAYVSGRGLVMENFTAPVSMSNGVLETANWQAQLYGGPASGAVVVGTQAPLSVQTRFEINDVQIDQVGGQLSDSSKASGTVSLSGSFATQGNSQRDLVMGLSGQGVLVASGLDANTAGQGAFAQVALAPVRALSQLGGLFGGGVTDGFASMGTQFSGTEGVFTLSDATIKSNVYSGEFTGTIDLPRWWIEADGRVRLQANLLTQLLGNRLQMPSVIPLSVNGSLDAPNVRMDTSGSADTQSEQQNPAAQPAAPLNEPKPNPLDLFQGILNEIAKPQ